MVSKSTVRENLILNKMKVFSSVLAALQISSISADTFHIRTGNVVHGFKINGEAFGVWSGGNSKKITLRAGEKIESVEFSQCTWHDLYVISEMTFITNWKKSYGPYGVCGKKNKSPGWARFRQTFSKRHVRLDRLRQQVQMTSNKYNGNKYVKSFGSMSKPYVQNCNSGYSGCSKTCGGGTQTCQNTCVHSSFGSVTECPNNRRTSSRNCNQKACPTWNDWSDFGACSATCEKGLSKKLEHVKMEVQVKLVAPEMQYSRSLVMKNHANVRLDLNVHPIKSLVSVLLMLTNIALHRHVGLTKTTLKLESFIANLRPRKSANALCT